MEKSLYYSVNNYTRAYLSQLVLATNQVPEYIMDWGDTFQFNNIKMFPPKTSCVEQIINN